RSELSLLSSSLTLEFLVPPFLRLFRIFWRPSASRSARFLSVAGAGVQPSPSPGGAAAANEGKILNKRGKDQSKSRRGRHRTKFDRGLPLLRCQTRALFPP